MAVVAVPHLSYAWQKSQVRFASHTSGILIPRDSRTGPRQKAHARGGVPLDIVSEQMVQLHVPLVLQVEEQGHGVRDGRLDHVAVPCIP